MIDDDRLEWKKIFQPEIAIKMIQLIAGSTAIHSWDFKHKYRCSRDEFSLIDRRNLTFNHSVDTESSLKDIRSKRFKDGRVYIDQFDEYIREYLTKSKNTSLYRRIGHNRLIVLINGSDETVHHEPLPLSRGRPITIGRVRGGHVLMRYKMRETAAVGSRSDAPDAFHRD